MLTALTRTLILYFLLMAGLRLLGKRQIGELEPSELVLALLISDLAAVPMQDFGIPLFHGIFPIFLLLSLSYIVSFLNLKSIRFRNLICGQATVIIQNGIILQQQMRRMRFTIDELLEELRLNGVTDLQTVQFAILETNGQLSITLFPEYQPLTLYTLQHKKSTGSDVPVLLISDGRVIPESLSSLHTDHFWLEQELHKRGHTSPRSVFLMTADSEGHIYLVSKEV